MTELTGIRFRQLRRQAALSQREVAAQLGMHQGQLSRLERGEGGLTIERMQAAAKILGTTLAYLYGETDDPAPDAAAPEQPPLPIDAPPVLRELAAASGLVRDLQVTAEDWDRLLQVPLPEHARLTDCVELLLLLRRIHAVENRR